MEETGIEAKGQVRKKVGTGRSEGEKTEVGIKRQEERVMDDRWLGLMSVWAALYCNSDRWYGIYSSWSPYIIRVVTKTCDILLSKEEGLIAGFKKWHIAFKGFFNILILVCITILHYTVIIICWTCASPKCLTSFTFNSSLTFADADLLVKAATLQWRL